jgi:glutathione S-transferase
MSEFVVHSVPGSPYGRAVFATLEEKRAAYRLAALAPGDAKNALHLARQPFGRVPVIEHGDFMLYETQAILRYINRVVSEPALAPTEPQAAARMDQVMNICDWYLFQGVANVIGFHRIVRPQLFGLAADEAAVAQAMPRAHTVFNELSRLLGERLFFGGNRLSLADLMVAPQFDFLSQTPEWQPLTGATPNLVGWLARVLARNSFKATTWERIAALTRAA